MSQGKEIYIYSPKFFFFIELRQEEKKRKAAREFQSQMKKNKSFEPDSNQRPKDDF